MRQNPLDISPSEGYRGELTYGSFSGCESSVPPSYLQLLPCCSPEVSGNYVACILCTCRTVKVSEDYRALSNLNNPCIDADESPEGSHY